MNNKVTPENFRASMDRVLSGSKADPFLASRIIAAEKGEPKMKKASVSIALVLLILIILATVAYAASKMSHSVNWKGETIHEYEYEGSDWDGDFKESAGISPHEATEITDKLIAGIPDSDDVYARYTAPNGFSVCSFHPKQKRFTSFEEFKEYMADYDYLTIPAWLPDNVSDFQAEVHMDMGHRIYKKGLKVDEYQEGPIYYRHFTYDDSRAIVSGYEIEFTMSKGGYVRISSSLRGLTEGPGYSFTEGDTFEVVSVKGMTDAVLVSRQKYRYAGLMMHRNLKKSVKCQLMDCEGILSCHEEYVDAESYYMDKDTILRIFNGE